MTSTSRIENTNVYMEDGKEFWDGVVNEMEDFYCGMEENTWMGNGNNVMKYSTLCTGTTNVFCAVITL